MSTGIPLFRQWFTEEAVSGISKDIEAVLRSGKLVFGENVRTLESEFSERMGGGYAASVNSCTTALEICLRFFGCEGMEVIVPSAGFVSDATSVWMAGGEAVFSDADPDTLHMTVETIEAVLTKKTRGVIFVHLLGMIWPEIVRVRDFCREKGLFLIEDCAHACGAEWKGTKAGCFGDAGCFSFYATKILSCGSGGFICTENQELDAYARRMRMFGKAEDGRIRHVGNDWYLDELRAVVLRHHLADLDLILEARGRIAARYCLGLSDMNEIRLFPEPEDSRFANYQFPVVLSNGGLRQDLQDALRTEYNIDSKPIYLPVHLEPIFEDRITRGAGGLAATEDMLDRTLVIPLFPHMSDEEQETVIQAVRVVLANLSVSK